MNVEICASKVVADNPSASAPQQGNTQMACIATLVWMRVKADHDLTALREGPAGHSSGAVGPIADVRRPPIS
jgi:hypothetical protein